jgi:hypothetical protein
MLAAGELIGVLHVGSRERRAFTSDDIQLVSWPPSGRDGQPGTAQPGRSGSRARRSEGYCRPGSSRFGRGLAARYVPGHDTGVGGAWYDVFNLPGGWLGVVVGDVSGRGLRAAVVMRTPS